MVSNAECSVASCCTAYTRTEDRSGRLYWCQSMRLCVTVCDLRDRAVSHRKHEFLVSSQRFPHLWKKLWKIAHLRLSRVFRADPLRFSRRRNRKKAETAGVHKPSAACGAINRHSPWAKVCRSLVLSANERLGRSSEARRSQNQ